MRKISREASEASEASEGDKARNAFVSFARPNPIFS
jgi:hypothetical protein